VLLLAGWLVLYITIVVAFHSPLEYLATVAAASGAVTVAVLLARRERSARASAEQSAQQMSARLGEATSLLANTTGLDDFLTQLRSLAERETGVTAGAFFLLDQASGNLYPPTTVLTTSHRGPKPRSRRRIAQC
jgi:hypothetical protein